MCWQGRWLSWDFLEQFWAGLRESWSGYGTVLGRTWGVGKKCGEDAKMRWTSFGKILGRPEMSWPDFRAVLGYLGTALARSWVDWGMGLGLF